MGHAAASKENMAWCLRKAVMNLGATEDDIEQPASG